MPCSCGYKKLFDEERQISTKYSGEFMDMFRKANEYRKKYDRLVVEYNELMEERNDLNLQVCILGDSVDELVAEKKVILDKLKDIIKLNWKMND